MKDIRIITKEISMCEGCHHFRVDDCAYGDACYSCNHPNGPGGKLTSKVIIERKIHKDCPLPKVIKKSEVK